MTHKLHAGDKKNNPLNANWHQLIKGLTPVDIMKILLLPLVWVMVMFLPFSIRTQMPLSLHKPSWWQFFTHAFIHRDVEHLMTNLAFLLMVSVALLILANRISKKQLLFKTMMFTVLVLPILMGILAVIIYPTFALRLGRLLGGSLIVSALVGFLPMWFIAYFASKTKTNLFSLPALYIPLSAILIVFATIYANHSWRTYPLLLGLLVLTVSLTQYLPTIRSICKIRFKKEDILEIGLLVLIILFFIAGLIDLFPKNPVTESGAVDFFAHYIGLAFGVIVSFLYNMN